MVDTTIPLGQIHSDLLDDMKAGVEKANAQAEKTTEYMRQTNCDGDSQRISHLQIIMNQILL